MNSNAIEPHENLRPNGENNPYHALVDDSKDIQGIGRANARYLASICNFKLID